MFDLLMFMAHESNVM